MIESVYVCNIVYLFVCIFILNARSIATKNLLEKQDTVVSDTTATTMAATAATNTF